MDLKVIATLPEFGALVPELVRLHDEFAARWDKDSTEGEFLSELIARFDDSTIFADFDETGRLLYLAIIYRDLPVAKFRVFHVDVTYRQFTKEILSAVKLYLLGNGFTECYFSTMRVTRSYDRWVRKWGAKQHEIVYKIDLQ